MLREAAEKGYDRLSWTTGDQQADRYDLSHHIGRVQYDPDANQPNRNKQVLHRRKASRIALLLFSSFRHALLGDGSFRKLTYVTQGAGTAVTHISIRLDTRAKVRFLF